MPTAFTKKATEFSRDLELDLNKPDLAFLGKTLDFLFEEVRETERAVTATTVLGIENTPADVEEIIDGFGDAAFIALNGIYKTFRMLGRDHETSTALVSEVMHRICDANLGKKQPDGSVKYNNGKVIKPEGWQAPAYSDLVGEQLKEAV